MTRTKKLSDGVDKNKAGPASETARHVHCAWILSRAQKRWIKKRSNAGATKRWRVSESTWAEREKEVGSTAKLVMVGIGPWVQVSFGSQVQVCREDALADMVYVDTRKQVLEILAGTWTCRSFAN